MFPTQAASDSPTMLRPLPIVARVFLTNLRQLTKPFCCSTSNQHLHQEARARAVAVCGTDCFEKCISPFLSLLLNKKSPFCRFRSHPIKLRNQETNRPTTHMSPFILLRLPLRLQPRLQLRFALSHYSLFSVVEISKIT